MSTNNNVFNSWNRLEGRPRTDTFDRVLRAEIRDPLWMLCRQWQMGEFIGDDAGSPVRAKVCVRSAPLRSYEAQAFDPNTPLEAQVEKRPFKPTLDIRLLLGRRAAKLLDESSLIDLKELFLVQLPKEENAYQESQEYYEAVQGKLLDGWRVYQFFKEKSTSNRFTQWVERFILQPREGEDTWDAAHLEYQFTASTFDPLNSQKEITLKAREYYHGRLDWYNLDIAKKSNLHKEDIQPGEMPKNLTKEFIPAPVRFAGMPNTRWWTFEDQQTNFGDLRPDTTDLAKLLLMEFGLVYGNDWYLTPLRLPVGTLSKVAGLVVSNTFGERFWISPANTTDPPGTESYDWMGWNLFGLKNTAENEIESCLLLLPTVPKIQESAPLEKVAFLRDEMANLVWGVESVITLPDGSTKPGLEAARERKGLPEDNSSGSKDGQQYSADLHYQIMTTVPENWIPFIAVQEKDKRNIRLQRAALPKAIPLANGEVEYQRVPPRTRLLSEEKSPYYVYEEEIPRAGVHVTLSYQRTRWLSGRTVVWLGVRKHTGRGEGSSGLAFDQAVDKKVKTDA